MIRIKLIQMLDDLSFKEGRKISLTELSEKTGLSRPTITRIINTRGYNLGLDGVDALCKFFRCTPGELLEFIDE